MQKIAHILLLAKQANLAFNEDGSLTIKRTVSAEKLLMNYKLCDQYGNLTPGGMKYEPMNKLENFNDKIFEKVVLGVLNEMMVRMENGFKLSDPILDEINNLTFYYNASLGVVENKQVPEVNEVVIEDTVEEDFLAQVLNTSQDQIDAFGVNEVEEIQIEKPKKARSKKSEKVEVLN